MTPSKAKRIAKAESTFYPQGGRWILSTWDWRTKTNRTSNPMRYHEMLQALREWRSNRVQEIMEES